ncbi:MAG: hypothetical protein HF978_10415 [Desulfobacteraceae bacterium]|nr:hypothetical protein [Desulfobacteraceae bacterium]MBC2755947.1 hypothetical protein [Desulfobacteraceae bacterium]
MTHHLKVFYGAAIQGAAERNKRAHINLNIIETIKSCGFAVISEHTTGLDFNDTANKLEDAIGPLPPVGKERTVFIRNKMIQFVESDISAAVFEVSTPSLGTGIEIAHAYLRPRLGLPTIPVIALYQNKFWPNKLSAMINGITEEKTPHFNLIEYDTPDDIPRLLKPVIYRLNESAPDSKKTSGRITARKCNYCGHHEVGVTTDTGEYVSLKPGMGVTII